MARLIKTEKEVEGRYTETWVVVEEDALDQWPAGPLDLVGRPARDGRRAERARGEALYTADLVFPGCSTRRPAQPARARARDAHRPRAGAGCARRARASSAPDDLDALDRRASATWAPVAAVAADTDRAGARRASS